MAGFHGAPEIVSLRSGSHISNNHGGLGKIRETGSQISSLGCEFYRWLLRWFWNNSTKTGLGGFLNQMKSKFGVFPEIVLFENTVSTIRRERRRMMC